MSDRNPILFFFCLLSRWNTYKEQEIYGMFPSNSPSYIFLYEKKKFDLDCQAFFFSSLVQRKILVYEGVGKREGKE